jgi:hypothetical protein
MFVKSLSCAFLPKNRALNEARMALMRRSSKVSIMLERQLEKVARSILFSFLMYLVATGCTLLQKKRVVLKGMLSMQPVADLKKKRDVLKQIS